MRFAEIQRGCVAAEQDRQFVVENFNDLLTGRDAAENGFAEGFLFDAGDEFFRDFKIDVGLEQSEPNLTQRGVDVRLADLPMPAEIFEDLLQFLAELGKQNYFFGVATGAAAGAPPSSIPNVQWVSTFLSPDFALRITVQLLSRSFCVT